MKILFVASLYHPHVGGIETFIAELAAELKKRSISSVVLTKRWPKKLPQRSRHCGIAVHRVTSAKTRDEFITAVTYLKKHEQELRADLIHVVGLRRPLPLLALILARRWCVPLVVTIAGSEIPDAHDPSTRVIWNASRHTAHPVLKQSDAVTAFSNALAQQTRHHFSDVSNIRVLYAGMHTKQFSPSKRHKKKKFYILSLRRLVYSKGVDLLIKAFANLKEVDSRMQLWIAGSGPEKKKLMAIARKLHLEQKVKFLGTVSIHKAATLLRHAQLAVVPSRSEGGGLINIEAQAAGCPLVASKVGGIPEYAKDKKTALLHTVNSVSDLRIKMEKLLKDAHLRNSLVKNGIKFAQTFDWNNLCPNYISLYGNVSSKKNYRRFYAWSPLSRDVWKFLQK